MLYQNKSPFAQFRLDLVGQLSSSNTHCSPLRFYRAIWASRKSIWLDAIAVLKGILVDLNMYKGSTALCRLYRLCEEILCWTLACNLGTAPLLRFWNNNEVHFFNFLCLKNVSYLSAFVSTYDHKHNIQTDGSVTSCLFSSCTISIYINFI